MPDTSHLSPRRLAGAIGVSESSIKRWVDAGRIESTLTAGGHRRIPLAAAIRFVRASGASVVSPEALGLPPVGADLGDALYRSLLEGRTESAVALLRALFASGSDAARIIDEALRVAMARLGRIWHDRGEQGVFLEHRATQIGVRILDELRSLQAPPTTVAPLAVGGAPAGDPYLLPTLSAATVLESVGFVTSNLGPETPDEAFVSAIDELRPALVWLSVTAPHRPAELERTVRIVGMAAEAVGGSLVLGGRESGRANLDGFRCQSMVELAAFARGLLAERAR